GQQLRVLDQEAPEGDERAVARPVAALDARVPLERGPVTRERAADVDAAIARDRLAAAAESADPPGLDPSPHPPGGPAPAPGGPGEAVELVALAVVLDDREVPGPVVGVVEAEARRRPPPGVDLEGLGEVGVAA